MTTLKEYKAMMEGATPAPWSIDPRHISACELIERGVDPFILAAQWPKEEWLQWELNGPDANVGRGDYIGADCAFIAASRNIAPELIRVIELARGLINQGNFTYLGAEYVFCVSPEKVKELEEKIKILTGE